MKSSFAILFAIFALSNAIELPKSLRPCGTSNPDYGRCLSEAVVPFMKSLATGNRDLGIPPLEPLVIDKITIGENNGPVSLKQEYRNIKLYGMTKGLTLKNYTIDFDKLILRSESYNPQVEFVGNYEMDGQVLVLPINGKGQSNITMFNLHSTNTIHCEKYFKNGEPYLRVNRYKIQFSPRKVLLKFDNLANGDKILGKQLQTFMDENSDLIFSELQASYEESFGLVFQKISNQVFSRFSMKTLFPDQ